MKYILVNKAIE